MTKSMILNARLKSFCGFTLERGMIQKKVLLLACWLCFLQVLQATEITIRSPAENETINATAIDSNFIFGQVNPVPTRFLINDTPVPVHNNGSFLAWLPIEYGEFVYSCRAITASDTVTVNRAVFYTPPKSAIDPDSLVFDSSSFRPNTELELLPGDMVTVGFRGTPGCRAFFSIDSLIKNAPMQEIHEPSPAYWGEAVFGQGEVLRPESVDGVYRASFQIPANAILKNAPVHFQLVHSNGDTVCARTDSVITVLNPVQPRIAETKLDLTVLRTGPRKSYYYFLPERVKLHVTGKYGSNYRVQLSETEDAWIEDYKIQFTPETTIPHFYIRLVRTQNLGRKARITVYGEHRVPYRFVQSMQPNQLKVLLYGVTADTDWIRYDFSDPLIQDIQWEQIENRVYAMTITLDQKYPWGYDAGFDEHDNFFLDIKKTPPIGWCKRASLKKLTILLDPGHEPDTGAIGPTGFAEKDANLLLANVLAKKLRKRGATVKFTHTGEGMSLLDRLKLTMRTDADILLSLHHNAIPAGVNPFKSRGSSTYYYHPQSRDLARLIQQHLLDELALPDFGLYWDNLAMCRPTQMPAVLIEPAFMMFPEEEMLIQSEKYRDRCSDAIIKALLEFAHSHRD